VIAAIAPWTQLALDVDDAVSDLAMPSPRRSAAQGDVGIAALLEAVNAESAAAAQIDDDASCWTPAICKCDWPLPMRAEEGLPRCLKCGHAQRGRL
jgi:hypothetical protein